MHAVAQVRTGQRRAAGLPARLVLRLREPPAGALPRGHVRQPQRPVLQPSSPKAYDDDSIPSAPRLNSAAHYYPYL